MAGRRVYQPGYARWMSRDPIGFRGGDWNLYRIVANNPVTHHDSTGLQPIQNTQLKCCLQKPHSSPCKPTDGWYCAFYGSGGLDGCTCCAQKVGKCLCQGPPYGRDCAWALGCPGRAGTQRIPCLPGGTAGCFVYCIPLAEAYPDCVEACDATQTACEAENKIGGGICDNSCSTAGLAAGYSYLATASDNQDFDGAAKRCEAYCNQSVCPKPTDQSNCINCCNGTFLSMS